MRGKWTMSRGVVYTFTATVYNTYDSRHTSDMVICITDLEPSRWGKVYSATSRLLMTNTTSIVVSCSAKLYASLCSKLLMKACCNSYGLEHVHFNAGYLS